MLLVDAGNICALFDQFCRAHETGSAGEIGTLDVGEFEALLDFAPTCDLAVAPLAPPSVGEVR